MLAWKKPLESFHHAIVAIHCIAKRKEKKAREGGTAYCVVFPTSYSVRVSSRAPQPGQSTGAGPSLRHCNGVAV